ncbi:hypothetical protein ACSBR2_018939 [Camellia fascicularis]
MLKLAELFCLAGIDVTFLNSEHNHCSLLRYTDVRTRFVPMLGSILRPFLMAFQQITRVPGTESWNCFTRLGL